MFATPVVLWLEPHEHEPGSHAAGLHVVPAGCQFKHGSF